jgi:hypothetical protein
MRDATKRTAAGAVTTNAWEGCAMIATKREIAACESGDAAAPGIADWLGLAAAPTFAIMALLTAILGGAPADTLCSAGHASPLGGMVPMYLLMSAFHLTPWLKLIATALGPAEDAVPRDIAPTNS